MICGKYIEKTKWGTSTTYWPIKEHFTNLIFQSSLEISSMLLRRNYKPFVRTGILHARMVTITKEVAVNN
jgi:hypothetical protein